MNKFLIAALLLLVLAGAGWGTVTVENSREETREHIASLTHGGDVEHGRRLIEHYGCGSCHTIPGIEGATANVGPPLATVGKRGYIAGVLPHSPENLMHWIVDPKSVDAKTAMPVLGVKPEEARHIAAYLYSLTNQ